MLIHQNQYGFLWGQTIHDCIVWTFEYLHWCHQSKKKIVIVKLDFKKTFNIVEHQVVIDILKFKGFGPRCISWIQSILSSRTYVLLNGVLGKYFIANESGKVILCHSSLKLPHLLQSIVNQAKNRGLLPCPVLMSSPMDFPILQYADGILLTMKASQKQVFFLKALLNTYVMATCLKVN